MQAIKTEREEFYFGVLVTAIEGGINFWCEVDDYKWRTENDEESADAYAEVVEFDEDENPDSERKHRIDFNTIRKAFALINKTKKEEGLPGLHHTYCKRFREAYAGIDAGDIDSYDASAIVQLGLFGEVIYG